MNKVIATMVAGFLALTLMGCISNSTGITPAGYDAIKLLKAQGYHDIFFTAEGYARCSLVPHDIDFDMHSFMGVSKEGHIVEGSVCNETIYIARTTR